MSVSLAAADGVILRFLNGLSAGTAFVRGLLARPGKVAAVAPSSAALLKQLQSLVQRKDPCVVVELGPGTGGTTRMLLNCLPSNGRLLAIEIVPEFVEQLRSIEDPRLTVSQSDAAQLGSLLEKYRMRNPDLVVSGVPFSTMQPSTANRLVSSIRDALVPGGLFVAYQVRDTISQYAGALFGEAKVSFVLWNLPPLRVYQWRKRDEDRRNTRVYKPEALASDGPKR